MQVQLYHKWRCPYSARVRDFVDEHGLSDTIEYVEVTKVEGADRKLHELMGPHRCRASSSMLGQCWKALRSCSG